MVVMSNYKWLQNRVTKTIVAPKQLVTKALWQNNLQVDCEPTTEIRLEPKTIAAPKVDLQSPILEAQWEVDLLYWHYL